MTISRKSALLLCGCLMVVALAIIQKLPVPASSLLPPQPDYGDIVGVTMSRSYESHFYGEETAQLAHLFDSVSLRWVGSYRSMAYETILWHVYLFQSGSNVIFSGTVDEYGNLYVEGTQYEILGPDPTALYRAITALVPDYSYI